MARCSAGSMHLGFYTTSVPDAIFGYPSSGYLDDLAWGAAWLYKATGNATYLTQSQAWFSAAQTNTSQSPTTPLAWNYDNQLPGTALLLANFSGWQNQTIVAEVWPHPQHPVPLQPLLHAERTGWCCHYGVLRRPCRLAVVAVMPGP